MAVMTSGVVSNPKNEEKKVNTDLAAKKSAASEKGKAFKAEGAQARSVLSQEEIALEGTKSDMLVFKAALGDTSRATTRTANENGQRRTDIKTHATCGYQFELREDMLIPEAPFLVEDGRLKNNITVSGITMKPRKKGEIVNLNLVETAALLSQIQFAGKATGDGNEVTLCFTFSADREDPVPNLRSKNGSVKDPMILVADVVEANGTKKYTVKEGFEAFAPLFIKPARAQKSASGTKKSAEGVAETAAAFRAYYAKKYGA